MEKKRSPYTSVSSEQNSYKSKNKLSAKPNVTLSKNKFDEITSERSPVTTRLKKDNASAKKAKGDYDSTASSSGTQFFRKQDYKESFMRITSDKHFGKSELGSDSTNTFHCVHGREGKLYTEKNILGMNLIKNLDAIPQDSRWNDNCPPVPCSWELVKKLEFLVKDPVGANQDYRLHEHLRDFASLSEKGYRVDVLDSVCVVIDYLIESSHRKEILKEVLVTLLLNMEKPILLTAASDVVSHFENIRMFIGFMGYLLIRVDNEDMFKIVGKALIWQLSAADSVRGAGAAQLRHVLPAAGPVLIQTVSRMLAVSDAYKFSTFLDIALLLACYDVDNCIEMMKENIIENICYRFNPYFPDRKLPEYDINPTDPQDYRVKLGDSSVNINSTISLLLILLKTTKEYLEKNPIFLPYPDAYGQRCFIWAYRYECRAREHQSERTSLTVIAAALLHCFGSKLSIFGSILMPDIMSLSVLTEVPRRNDWIGRVGFNTGQLDVQFKKTLICLSVQFLKVFPYNKFMVETRYWLLGLIYMIDPGLCLLRSKWSPSLFAELRKTTLQALICVLPLTAPRLAVEYGLTRRIMWYIEWYSESPFELPILYWCIRLLVVIVENKPPSTQKSCLNDLFDTHGVIIIVHLCYTLLEQKQPPIEKAQAIIALSLRLLANAVNVEQKISCCVYPSIRWPSAINGLVKRMLDMVMHSLDEHFIVSDRWLVSLLDFIWEAVIWNHNYRANFVADNGVYKLLDIITMTRAPVQCIALAIICDVARAGDGVGQLVTWRATVNASHTHSNLVKRGATIASLLAAIFRDECLKTGIHLDEHGVIEDLDFPILSAEVRAAIYHRDFAEGKNQRTPVSLVAGDLAGSRLSKVFALLHLLSNDLEYMVSLADEAYNMYKNIKLSPDDETVLILCSHYLTLKLNEIWLEAKLQCPNLLQQDKDSLQEFLHIGRGWAKEIRKEQENVIETFRKKEQDEESSLYAFLARVSLNIALDALREVRCVARSGDRVRMTTALIHDAVLAHHRRSVAARKLESPIIRTYGPMLDDQNVTGQHVKVRSITTKIKH